MAMISCHECGKSISSSASSCPSCGAKVPRFKWWLWFPLGIGALFVAFGLMTPEYRTKAREKREICEALVGPFEKEQCRRIYDADIARGQASGRSDSVYEPPIDKVATAAADKARAADDAEKLKDCQQNIVAKKAEYRRLMAAREYWSASLVLRRCAELQDNQAVKAMVADAEQKEYISEIATAPTKDARTRALDALRRDYPEVGAKYSVK
ncbi:MAG: hypothetical protein V4844_03445 [Pseudomonadota bacterium]